MSVAIDPAMISLDVIILWHLSIWSNTSGWLSWPGRPTDWQISNNPKYREKTLQSQEPFIETVDAVIFPNRELAKAVEKGLHTKFKRKRIWNT